MVVVVVVFIAIFFTLNDSSEIKELHSNHSQLNIGDSLKGKVVSQTSLKGALFLTVGNKMSFIHTAANYKYAKIHLYKIIEIGDSVIKHPGSDTIFLYKSNLKYYFINNKRINK